MQTFFELRDEQLYLCRKTDRRLVRFDGKKRAFTGLFGVHRIGGSAYYIAKQTEVFPCLMKGGGAGADLFWTAE